MAGGKAMVSDLVEAVQTGGRTACDIEHACRATEIGFAIHGSSMQGGAKVDLPLAERSSALNRILGQRVKREA